RDSEPLEQYAERTQERTGQVPSGEEHQYPFHGSIEFVAVYHTLRVLRWLGGSAATTLSHRGCETAADLEGSPSDRPSTGHGAGGRLPLSWEGRGCWRCRSLCCRSTPRSRGRQSA